MGRAFMVLFGALFLAPDISMLPYLVNVRVGAACYNAAHTVTCAALLGGADLLTSRSLVLSLATIWLAHIGFDRVLGYGLKYSTGFGDTHLGHLGLEETTSKPRSRGRICRA
jgi:Domain of unknown function (DUF4260)